ERAGLLERMTGTEIYGVISMEAHARAADERRKLESLHERAALAVVMSEDERRGYEEKAKELELRQHQDRQALYAAQKAQDWHATRAALAREEQAAREEHAHIEAQLALWETRRSEVAAYTNALPVRPWIEAADRARVVLE